MKTFIYCKPNLVTGGIELLYQLADLLNKNGYEAFIISSEDGDFDIPSDYIKYNAKKALKIEDAKENVIVIPEVFAAKIKSINHARVILWWLSIDNYYFNYSGSFLDLWKFSKPFAIKSIAKKIMGKIKNDNYSISCIQKNARVINAYQSEYAKSFLSNKGITNLVPLKDYINEDYVYNSCLTEKKEDIIIYNPKKGMKFTKLLMKCAPKFKWIPIQNMNRQQVRDLMDRAKVYIDFGNHPGKDRMPRESAMCGCCIITGKKGSAGFSEDVFIDEGKYKFIQQKYSIPDIIACIEDLMTNYSVRINDYDAYRKIIATEKSEFEEQVKTLFNKLSKEIS